ncbi:MAG TPA: 2-oxoglutarate ferredoxin oxidoreductase subunit alpha [Planctomycetales bacterium]|nr:2-oxoglutarate ferredoxin oxidoreductase subunit alpha [Planctomycetales bacterium]
MTVQERNSVVVRLAGDSGDGIQLIGAQLTRTSVLCGDAVWTTPDFPAEIRAPAGSLAGVSGFQVQFGGEVLTAGDRVDALVAMNPAALKTHLKDLDSGGILIVNRDAFHLAELAKAGYITDPLQDGSLRGRRLLAAPITTLNREAVADRHPGSPPLLSQREVDRCKNFFALGLVYWLFERPLEQTLDWIKDKFARNPAVLEANRRALTAGYHYGETTEAMPAAVRVTHAPLPAGRYRTVTGNEALALGLVAAARTSGLPLLYAAYPIAPASNVLHRLAELKRYGVRTFQAEDEIAAMGAAVGAAFGGGLGATATSGPGLSLKSEAIGLAVMAELPVIVIDVQRGGPSLGLPTKTEQTDLFQALYGRHGECPAAVLAAQSPADCFATVYEAVRLAVAHMTPVLVLSDGCLAVGAEPWRIPDPADLPPIPVRRPTAGGDAPFQPYQRDERHVRPWAVPGAPGLEHRIGGLEKEDGTGAVSYDPLNHERMVRTRAEKIARIADDIPELAVDGPTEGDLLVVGWGGTFGAIATAVRRAQTAGLSVAHAHFRYLNPMPRNTSDVLGRYKKVLVPELNTGQLRRLLRSEYLIDAVGLNKVQGRPFLVHEIEEKIRQVINTDN